MKRPFQSDKSRNEAAIEAAALPPSLRGRLTDEIGDADWAPVERSMRDWFICCANAKRKPLGVPSRVVQWLWEAFADDPSYDEFRRAAGIRTDPGKALAALEDWKTLAYSVEAWDRSQAGKIRDTLLWSLDEQLQIENPIGLGSEALEQLRSDDDPRYGGPFAYGGGSGGGM